MRHTNGKDGVSGSFEINPHDGSFLTGKFVVDRAAKTCNVSIHGSSEDVQYVQNKTKLNRETSIFPSFIEQENFEKSCGKDSNVHSFISTLWGYSAMASTTVSGKSDEMCFNQIFTAESNADDLATQFDKPRHESVEQSTKDQQERIIFPDSAQMDGSITTVDESIVPNATKPPSCRCCPCCPCHKRHALQSQKSALNDLNQPQGHPTFDDKNTLNILNRPDPRFQRIPNSIQSFPPKLISNIHSSIPPLKTTHSHYSTPTIAKNTGNILPTTNKTKLQHRRLSKDECIKDDVVEIDEPAENSVMTSEWSNDGGSQSTCIPLNNVENIVRNQQGQNGHNIDGHEIIRTESNRKDDLALDDDGATKSEQCTWNLKETMAEFDEKFPDEDNEASLYDTVSQYGKAK